MTKRYANFGGVAAPHNKRRTFFSASLLVPTTMPDSPFESHRAQVSARTRTRARPHRPPQLAASLAAVAESMRNCAQLADSFAKIVGDSAYSQEAADLLHGTSPPPARAPRLRRANRHAQRQGPGPRNRRRRPQEAQAQYQAQGPQRPQAPRLLLHPLPERGPQGTQGAEPQPLQLGPPRLDFRTVETNVR
jgi:hypothetical protein